MPLPSEYGLKLGDPLPSDSIDELLKEPTPEWLKTFGDQYEVKNDGMTKGANMGKFVVIRNFVVVAPFPAYIYHLYIADGILRSKTLHSRYTQERLEAEKEKLPLLRSAKSTVELTDAGHFQLPTHMDPDMIILGDRSEEFGRGNRKQTFELFQKMLGDDIEVVVTD